MFCSRPETVCVRPSRQIVVSAFMDDSKAAKAPKAPKAPKKAKEDKEEKIKRAPSAYNLFFKATFPEVKKTLPEGAKITELTGKLSQMWKELSEEQKRPYQAESDKLKGEVATLRCSVAARRAPNRRGCSERAWVRRTSRRFGRARSECIHAGPMQPRLNGPSLSPPQDRCQGRSEEERQARDALRQLRRIQLRFSAGQEPRHQDHSRDQASCGGVG